MNRGLGQLRQLQCRSCGKNSHFIIQHRDEHAEALSNQSLPIKVL
jgi:hypothetical protein